MSEPATIQDEADLPIDEFIARGNLRERGQDVPTLPGADPADSSTELGKVEDSPDVSAELPKPPVADKRTREGRVASIQSQIDGLTAQKHTVSREVETERAELARLKAEREALARPAQQQPPAQAQTEQDPEPQWADYAQGGKRHQADDADPASRFMRDVASWEGRRAYRTEAAHQRADAIYQHRTGRLREKLTAYEQTHPGWFTTLNPTVAALEFSTPTARGTTLGDLIMDSDVTPELMVHFHEHFDDFQRISTLPPVLQGRAIGAIEHAIETRKTVASAQAQPPKPHPISTAKPTIKPVASSPVITDDEGDDADDLSEAGVVRHFKRENDRDRRAARAR